MLLSIQVQIQVEAKLVINNTIEPNLNPILGQDWALRVQNLVIWVGFTDRLKNLGVIGSFVKKY